MYDLFDLFKEKQFSSLRRDNEPFGELITSKMEETAQYFGKRFNSSLDNFALETYY
jgi:hypothetical protein